MITMSRVKKEIIRRPSPSDLFEYHRGELSRWIDRHEKNLATIAEKLRAYSGQPEHLAYTIKWLREELEMELFADYASAIFAVYKRLLVENHSPDGAFLTAVRDMRDELRECILSGSFLSDLSSTSPLSNGVYYERARAAEKLQRELSGMVSRTDRAYEQLAAWIQTHGADTESVHVSEK